MPDLGYQIELIDCRGMARHAQYDAYDDAKAIRDAGCEMRDMGYMMCDMQYRTIS